MNRILAARRPGTVGLRSAALVAGVLTVVTFPIVTLAQQVPDATQSYYVPQSGTVGSPSEGATAIRNFFEDAPTRTIVSNVLTVDMAVQNVVPFSFNANITTTTITNIPTTSQLASITWFVTANGSAFTWAWLTSTVVWDGGVAPTFVTTNNHVMAFTTYTLNGGTTWRGVQIAGNYAS